MMISYELQSICNVCEMIKKEFHILKIVHYVVLYMLPSQDLICIYTLRSPRKSSHEKKFNISRLDSEYSRNPSARRINNYNIKVFLKIINNS